MLLVLLFLVAYLLPVLPVARRIHYVRTRPQLLYTIPARSISKKEWGKRSRYSYNYVMVEGGGYLKASDVCNNCGGDMDYHPGYSYGTHTKNSPERYTCDEFDYWDAEVFDWPSKAKYSDPSDKSIPFSLLLGAAWPLFVSTEVAKRTYLAIDPDWSKFAVEYKGAETKDAKIARLQSEVTAAEAKTGRILAGVDKVETLEELDALVS